MDRESYESAEIAAILNAHFIAVKVDRDERPDVDARYQAAVAAISGQGGWPLTVFLTPEGKPFFGGTYFPPQDGYGRPSFQQILLAIAQAFRERRDEVETESEGLMHALAHSEGMPGHSGEFSPRIVEQMVQSALGAFDRENGGFGQAPKFPHPPVIDLLLDWYARTGEEQVGKVDRAPRWKRWREAESMTSLPEASIATRWMSAGACRTSRRWPMTTPSC